MIDRRLVLRATTLVVASMTACDIYLPRDREADAGTTDARSPRDAPAGDAVEYDAWAPLPRICSQAESSANVSGITPLGEVAYAHVWPGYFGGKCSDIQLFFTAASEVDANDLTGWPVAADTLSVWIGSPGTDGFEGVHDDVGVQVTVDGTSVTARGAITIEHFDEPFYGGDETSELRGHLTIATEDGTWSLDGSFGARYCEHLLTACP